MQYNVLTILTTMVAMANAITIHVCTGEDKGEECTDMTFGKGDCAPMPFRGISSIYLNGYTCIFYSDPKCEGQHTTFTSDQTDLGDTTWNDQLETVRC
ncbi:hypothetical protein F66182_3793 [Fusarium sp. NRRL 66182]|nr:hypothetical protein F66182_3793 [Fusarium sp. NRRL 66182]